MSETGDHRSSLPPSLTPLLGPAETAREKQCYLQQVERFCRQAKNDWYRVYLVRKLSSQRGIEYVQQFCAQGHPARWIFPEEALLREVRTPGLCPHPHTAP